LNETYSIVGIRQSKKFKKIEFKIG